MSDFDRNALVSAMRRLSIEGGAAIMEIYQRDDMGVRAKADASPVTEADEAADRLISAGLRAAFPELPLVTEEQAGTHNLSVTTFLIVDPLDGTKEFVKRRGDFTVNIALVEDGIPTLGVVYAPAKKRLFLTPAGGGAVEESGDLDRLQLDLRIVEGSRRRRRGVDRPRKLAPRHRVCTQRAFRR